jgi:hypothetical protein
MGGAQARPGYWLRIGTGYRSADGTIDATCEPLVIGPHLRLVEIARGDTDNLTTLLGWPGGGANDPRLLNSACLARMEHAQ